MIFHLITMYVCTIFKKTKKTIVFPPIYAYSIRGNI